MMFIMISNNILVRLLLLSVFACFFYAPSPLPCDIVLGWGVLRPRLPLIRMVHMCLTFDILPQSKIYIKVRSMLDTFLFASHMDWNLRTIELTQKKQKKQYYDTILSPLLLSLYKANQE